MLMSIEIKALEGEKDPRDAGDVEVRFEGDGLHLKGFRIKGLEGRVLLERVARMCVEEFAEQTQNISY
jgi:hypothetical protein